ncbi:divalent-cation tolerance protein CutA [Pelistega sp. NLN82]|uniref:Divalent-cation tolerance protein CutA n=1 Tax=Pelistega ratti TaxID=2652177 RepID=A0A6L9Y752_9BURK|nr:divalent-cation tolerance protein CutA [Pelistega ratti]NEN76005.1 divalent-cation tolerance protein CutA [Pelistega ratti]
MVYSALLIQTTVSDLLFAKQLAQILVKEHLAACVHIAPQGLSLYQWENTLERNEELTLSIKTSQKAAKACMARVQALHPYEVPEIICLPIIDGLPDYLSWIEDQTREY